MMFSFKYNIAWSLSKETIIIIQTRNNPINANQEKIEDLWLCGEEYLLLFRWVLSGDFIKQSNVVCNCAVSNTMSHDLYPRKQLKDHSN